MFHHPLPWKDYWTQASLVAASQGLSRGLLFTGRRLLIAIQLLLKSTGHRLEVRSFHTWGTQAQELLLACGLSCSRTRGIFSARDRTHVPCTDRWISIHCANQRSPDIEYFLNLVSSPSNWHLIMYILDNIHNGQISIWQCKHFYVSKKLKWPGCPMNDFKSKF